MVTTTHCIYNYPIKNGTKNWVHISESLSPLSWGKKWTVAQILKLYQDYQLKMSLLLCPWSNRRMQITIKSVQDCSVAMKFQIDRKTIHWITQLAKNPFNYKLCELAELRKRLQTCKSSCVQRWIIDCNLQITNKDEIAQKCFWYTLIKKGENFKQNTL